MNICKRITVQTTARAPRLADPDDFRASEGSSANGNSPGSWRLSAAPPWPQQCLGSQAAGRWPESVEAPRSSCSCRKCWSRPGSKPEEHSRVWLWSLHTEAGKNPSGGWMQYTQHPCMKDRPCEFTWKYDTSKMSLYFVSCTSQILPCSHFHSIQFFFFW